MFQPGSGTALSLGSIANVVSLLYLPDHQFFFWIFTFHPPCSDLPPILHPHIERHCSFSSLLPPFYSGLGLPVHTSVYSCRPPPPVPAIAVLPPLTYSPGTSRPMHPCSASPFLLPCPLSGFPLSPPLTSLAPLSTPVSNSF